MDLPVRKHPRLPSHDYTDGWYFITICTDGRKNLLSTIVGRGLAPAETVLTRYGKIAEEELTALPNRYTGLQIDHYVIMPITFTCFSTYKRREQAPALRYQVFFALINP